MNIEESKEIIKKNKEVSCKYCQENVSISYGNGLNCKKCSNYIHVTCLKRQCTPGGIHGDVFFYYTCAECSESGNEEFERHKMTWFQIIILALYHLQYKTPGITQNGFLHWKIHLVTFIDRKWSTLFPKQFKRRKNWMGTVSGSLSHFSPCFVTSGFKYLGESGWWRLTFPKLTPSLTVFIYNRLVADKNVTFKNVADVNSVTEFVREYAPDALTEECQSSFSTDINDIDVVDEQVKSTESPGCQSLFHYDLEVAQLFQGNDVQSVEKVQEVPNSLGELEVKAEPAFKWSKTNDFYSLWNKNETKANNDFYSLWNKNETKTKKVITDEGIIVPLRPIEEKMLLTYVLEHNIDRRSRALKRKLFVRTLKRNHGLHLLTIHNTARSSTAEREKDRFCHYYVNNDNTANSSTKENYCSIHEIRLAGGNSACTDKSVSPYTNRLLKPYIRRDPFPSSLWLQLTSELLNLLNPGVTRKISTLDYCYVRPNHIPAINSLCEQHFWPGINMADTLEYPDFSCVVLYRKLIVAFAFMIPDVKFNETYLSFVFTRPEWRKCGIATLMIYHLIQTCMGKDVTLHVAIDNPAILLYQKFGFKVEEVVFNFYDAYLRDDSNQCKHAFFLRLER